MYMAWTGIYIYVQTHMYNYILYVHSINMYMSVNGTDISVPFCQILSRWSGFQMDILHEIFHKLLHEALHDFT
jgi:hypothetical protein